MVKLLLNSCCSRPRPIFVFLTQKSAPHAQYSYRSWSYAIKFNHSSFKSSNVKKDSSPKWPILCVRVKPGFHYPSWRLELTTRVDGWPVSITRRPSTRLVETGLESLNSTHCSLFRVYNVALQTIVENERRKKTTNNDRKKLQKMHISLMPVKRLKLTKLVNCGCNITSDLGAYSIADRQQQN